MKSLTMAYRRQIYPLTEQITNTNIEYNSDDGVVVRIRFIDLFDVKNSLIAIAQEFKDNN